MAHLRGQFFGQIQIWRNEAPMSDFAYDKVRALLIFLWTEADRPHHRDALATLLWPETDDNRARTNLRKALSSLRQTIGDHAANPPLLLITRETIQFNSASDTMLDVAIFRSSTVQRGAHNYIANNSTWIRRLEQAADLYRGDFLGAGGMDKTTPFGEWAIAMRETLHQQAVEILTQLAAHYDQHGTLELAQRWLRQLLSFDPWDEAAHRALMRVLAQRGQRGAALQQFERCRDLLDADFGLEPEAATVALREQICSGTLFDRAA